LRIEEETQPERVERASSGGSDTSPRPSLSSLDYSTAPSTPTDEQSLAEPAIEEPESDTQNVDDALLSRETSFDSTCTAVATEAHVDLKSAVVEEVPVSETLV